MLMALCRFSLLPVWVNNSNNRVK